MGLATLLKNKANQKIMLLGCLWFSILVTAILLRAVLLPFILASLLAFVLDPAVSALSQLKIGRTTLPRWAAVLSVYMFIGAVVYFFATIFLPELYRELLRLAKVATDTINEFNQTQIYDLAARIDLFFQKYGIPIQIIAPIENTPPDEAVQVAESPANLISINLVQVIRNMINEIADYVRTESMNIVGEVQYFIRQVLNFIFKFFLVLMIAGFILVDTDRIKRFAFNLIPTKDREAFDALLARIDRGLSGVVRGQLIICLVNALLTLIGLLIFKVKFALLLATLAGVFSLIPIFGSIISTIPITIVALTISPLTAVLALAWILGIHALEANFLNPKIMGNAAKIHPVLVVLALVAGEHFYGLVGALLAVPLASILLNIFHALLHKTQEQKKTPSSA